MIPRSVLSGRRIAACGLALAFLVAAALCVALVSFWLTGDIPLALAPSLESPGGTS